MNNKFTASLGEEDMVLFNKLSIIQKEFDDKLKEKARGEEIYTRMDGDLFVIAKGDAKIELVTAHWHAIAQYGAPIRESSREYYWMWNNPKHEKINEALVKLGENMQFISKHDTITSQDPMMIPFLQSFLCEYVPYESIFRQHIGDTDYIAIGLFDIEWKLEVIEPIFDEEV